MFAKKSLIAAGAMTVALATGAVLATTSQGEDFGAVDGRSAVALTKREAAYLVATQKELAGTKLAVSSIALSATQPEREIYVLTGENDVCLLFAIPSEPDGKSTSLSCAPRASAVNPATPLVAEYLRGETTVSAVLTTDGSSLSAKAGSISVVDSKSPNVKVFERPIDEAADFQLTTRNGTAQVKLPSTVESERKANEAARAAFQKK